MGGKKKRKEEKRKNSHQKVQDNAEMHEFVCANFRIPQCLCPVRLEKSSEQSDLSRTENKNQTKEKEEKKKNKKT